MYVCVYIYTDTSRHTHISPFSILFFFVSRRPHLLHPRVIGALKFKTTTDLFALLKSLNCQSSERASRLQCFCVRARVCVCVRVFFSFLFSKHLQNIPSLLDRACGGRYLFLSLPLFFRLSRRRSIARKSSACFYRPVGRRGYTSSRKPTS